MNYPFVIVCPVMKSNVNVSSIARTASCFGINKLIVTGHNAIDKDIARNLNLIIENHRSILPVISKYKTNGYKLIGLEQSKHAIKMHEYRFEMVPTVLVVGHEGKGIVPEIMQCLDEVIEIQQFGVPHSLNVATATSILLYEYSKQMVFESNIHAKITDQGGRVTCN